MELSSKTSASYFLSWGWVENWLRSLPENILVHLAVISENSNPIAAFFLGETKIVRNSVFRSHSFFLNSTGVPRYDSLCIEYNSILCSNSHGFTLNGIIALLPDSWEEIVMPGLDPEAFPGKEIEKGVGRYNLIVEESVSSPYVNLDMIRNRGIDYITLLSSNTRQQIRRSYKNYELKGPLVLEEANNMERGLSFYDEMVDYHQKTWQKRGEKGAFANKYFYGFHHDLILSRFNEGEIQLLRVACGDVTIGILYNFIYRNTIYFYQSGINYEYDSRSKPGLVCHVEAIRHNVKLGHNTYDFLGGASQYKASLATNERHILFVKIQKPLLKFIVENKLKTIKRFLLKKNT